MVLLLGAITRNGSDPRGSAVPLPALFPVKMEEVRLLAAGIAPARDAALCPHRLSAALSRTRDVFPPPSLLLSRFAIDECSLALQISRLTCQQKKGTFKTDYGFHSFQVENEIVSWLITHFASRSCACAQTNVLSNHCWSNKRRKKS